MDGRDRPDPPPRDRSVAELRAEDPKFVVALERFLQHPEVAPLFRKNRLGPAVKRIVENSFAGGYTSALRAEWERRIEARVNESSDYEALGLVCRPEREPGDTVPFLLTPGGPVTYYEAAPVEPPQVGAPVFLDGKKVGVVVKVVEKGVDNWDLKIGEPPAGVLAGPGLRPIHVVSGTEPNQ